MVSFMEAASRAVTRRRGRSHAPTGAEASRSVNNGSSRNLNAQSVKAMQMHVAKLSREEMQTLILQSLQDRAPITMGHLEALHRPSEVERKTKTPEITLTMCSATKEELLKDFKRFDKNGAAWPPAVRLPLCECWTVAKPYAASNARRGRNDHAGRIC